MALITLLTDFGLKDEYVGVMKGVIAAINPDVRTIDICHHVAPQSIVHGAYLLAAAYDCFPADTVHVAVVDPGVGGTRRILALACDGHRFVVPDNGLIERVAARRRITEVVAVEERRFFREPVSRTFHGRDIFAPVAAHWAAGQPLAAFGPAVDPRHVVHGVVPASPLPTADAVDGVVIATDRFGNLMTNIEAAAVDRLGGVDADPPLIVAVAGRSIGPIVRTYNDAPPQSPLALIGSRGLLEISINRGDARQVLNAARGDRVRVQRPLPPSPGCKPTR